MAYRAEFSINRIGKSTASPSDRTSLLLEVRDYLVEKIQDDDSSTNRESTASDGQAYADIGENPHFNSKVRNLSGRLYSEVRDYIERQIRGNDSRTDIESDVANDRAYAKIEAERHFNDKLWRLSVRLYSNDDELRAEVFFGVALEDEVSSSSAPMFMQDLVERYDCRVGPYLLGMGVYEEGNLADLLFTRKRRLPVLMVSRDARGNLPYGGIDRLSERLLGMAHVVEAPPQGRYRAEWGYQFDVWDGAARIIWPGARPHFMGDGYGGFYRPGRRDFISEVLNDLDRNGSPESFDREFVAVNIACMRFRNEQLRSSVQTDESSELKRIQRQARKVERERERLEHALATEQTERTRAENLLDTALRDVERLGEELEKVSTTDSIARVRKETRDLRQEKDELQRKLADRENTNLKLNDELQRYRQKERVARNEKNGFDSLIGDPTQNPGQLSLAGHGLNVMRDPVRMFIIERLAHGIARNYGLDDIGSALDRLGVDTYRAHDYASALDFSNFNLVVSSYSKCFGQNAYILSNRLERIRTSRNRTIHPGFYENAANRRSEALLNDISIILAMIGASEESKQVTELKNAL
jgi:hypothetical protein